MWNRHVVLKNPQSVEKLIVYLQIKYSTNRRLSPLTVKIMLLRNRIARCSAREHSVTAVCHFSSWRRINERSQSLIRRESAAVWNFESRNFSLLPNHSLFPISYPIYSAEFDTAYSMLLFNYSVNYFIETVDIFKYLPRRTIMIMRS